MSKRHLRKQKGGETYVPPLKEREKTQQRIITKKALGFINKFNLISKLDNFNVLENSINTNIDKNINKENDIKNKSIDKTMYSNTNKNDKPINNSKMSMGGSKKIKSKKKNKRNNISKSKKLRKSIKK